VEVVVMQVVQEHLVWFWLALVVLVALVVVVM
jgi:hypothetical protein